MEKDNLLVVFNSWLEKDHKIVVNLLNRNKELVAALYLDKIFTRNSDLSDVTIVETNTSEKYYLFINGVGIFFTYYTK